MSMIAVNSQFHVLKFNYGKVRCIFKNWVTVAPLVQGSKNIYLKLANEVIADLKNICEKY